MVGLIRPAQELIDGFGDGGRPATKRLLATEDRALISVLAGVLAERPVESCELLTAGLTGDAHSELRLHYAYMLGLQRERKVVPALVEAPGDPDEAGASSAVRHSSR